EILYEYFFSSRRRHTRFSRDWSSDVCSSDLWYNLGNLWYDKRQYPEAINCWEQSAKADPGFPTVHRNLSLAYHNKLKEKDKAIRSEERRVGKEGRFRRWEDYHNKKWTTVAYA